MSSDNSRHGDNSLIPPARLSHAVLRTTRLEEMIQWYRIVLGAEVLYRNDVIAFLAYDHEHHRVALAAVPGLVERPKRSEEGLDHLAFFYSTFAHWIANYERLKTVGITPKIRIHHGLTISLYYRDPDDNGVKLSIDNVELAQWHHWMREQLGRNPIDVPLDPMISRRSITRVSQRPNFVDSSPSRRN